MERFKVINGECFTISVVEEPAIEEEFIKLNRVDKQILIGPALIPDKPIYRYNNGEEYTISFDADTIKQIAADYLKHLEVSIDHNEPIPATVLESWIKESENDKSVDYGFDLPIGTWFVAIHIDDSDLWEDIKNNKYGFSIEVKSMLEKFMKSPKLEELSTENDSLKEESDSLKQQIADAAIKIAELESALVAKESEFNSVVGEKDSMIAELSNKVAELEEANAKLTSEKEEAINRLAELEATLKGKEDELVEVKEELSKQPTVLPIKRNPYADIIKFLSK